MNSYKIGILVISTSRGRNWKHIKECYLYKIFLKTFLLTINKEHQYDVYIGIDKGDSLLDNKEQQDIITNFTNVFKNILYK